MRKLDRGREIARRRRGPRDLRAPRRAHEPSLLRRLLRWMMPARPADTLAAFFAAVATAAVLVNALWMQPVRHPAPLFAEPAKPAAASQPVTDKRTVPAAPAPKATATPIPPQRPDTATVKVRTELVADVQRELAQLGFYEGAVDGILGPRTDQAIRDFEQWQGLKISGEPTPMLLDVMRRARGKSGVTGSIPAAEPKPSTRVLAVQRVLARLGYGPLDLSGLPDAATRSAIEKFERDRGLAKTGEISDRLTEELALVTGAPVE